MKERSGAPVEMLQQLATSEFLGRGPIVGVGISANSAEGLIFFLEAESVATERTVQDWAQEHNVRVEFLVSGPIESLRRR
jgi:hypothetical protein